jgi:hypothetical protein
MSSEYIKTLSLNPFFGSKIIAHFVAGYGKEIDLPLTYLVLPFVLYEPSRSVLKSAVSKSSIYTLFLDKDKQPNVAGIEKRYEVFKELSKQSLIVAYNENLLVVKDKVSICGNPLKYQDEKNLYVKQYYRSAHYLGRIFSGYTTFDVLVKVGVKNI